MISIIEKEGAMIFSHSLKIQYIFLASCNLTKFPASLEYIDTIQRLDLSNNQIEGAIPSWVWEKHLMYLDLSHNKFTSLEKSLSDPGPRGCIHNVV
jgi:Leucine-rich repeat (LRR) protein